VAELVPVENILRCIDFAYRPDPLTQVVGSSYDARRELDALLDEVARLRRWIQLRVERPEGAELMVAVCAEDGFINTMPWWQAAARGEKCP
jgi:hypothetical protein